MEREAEDNPGKLVTVDMNVVHSMALASMHIRATYIYIYNMLYICVYVCIYFYTARSPHIAKYCDQSIFEEKQMPGHVCFKPC